MQKERKIRMIAALSEKDRVIGKDNFLPWKISADMKHFREVTKGQTVVMGRKTFESIGRPLPNRVNIVITRDRNFSNEGCVVVHSFEKAIEVAREGGEGDIFIIGGGQVYEQGMKVADRLDLTIVKGKFDGDVFFPDFSEFNKVISKEDQEEGEHKFTFVVLEK